MGSGQGDGWAEYGYSSFGVHSISHVLIGAWDGTLMSALYICGGTSLVAPH